MKPRNVAALTFLLLSPLLVALPALSQQQPAAAPIPSPILTAKTVFISNASGEYVEPTIPPTGAGNLAYNEFYTAMKDWGRYQLVSSPGEADLVIEIRFAVVGSPSALSLRATIFDPKTRTILWAFSQRFLPAARKATSRHNFDQSMAALVADLKNLTGSAGTTSQP
jgi:hypothetical protein